MSKRTYQQCQLLKNHRHGTSIQVSYIPTKFASKGNVIKLKKDNGEWEDGWVVDEIFGTPVVESTLPDWRKSIRSHRSTTGDSTPKGEC